MTLEDTTLLLLPLASTVLASLKDLPTLRQPHLQSCRPPSGSIAMKETTVEAQYFSSTVSRTVENPEITALTSPPHTKTPPPGSGNRSHANGNNINRHERALSEAIDPSALSRALEEVGRTRERTPGGTPSRKRQRVYGDRLVAAYPPPR